MPPPVLPGGSAPCVIMLFAMSSVRGLIGPAYNLSGKEVAYSFLNALMSLASKRRPADIYLPCFRGEPTALDLAVTACQQMEFFAEAGRQGGAAAASYARLKAAHMDCSACAPQGVKFLPMVLESTGAWDPAAARVLWEIARAAAAREGAELEQLHGQLLQDLCATVRTRKGRSAAPGGTGRRSSQSLDGVLIRKHRPWLLLTVERVMASAEFATLQTFKLVMAWPECLWPKRNVPQPASSLLSSFFVQELFLSHSRAACPEAPAQRAHVPHVVEMICVQTLHARVRSASELDFRAGLSRQRYGAATCSCEKTVAISRRPQYR